MISNQTKKLKIAWIVPGFQSDAADRCIPALTDLAHRVAEQHSLKVYALQYPGREDCYKIGQVTIQSFQPGPPAKIARLGRVGPLFRTLRAIRREPPDLLHAFWAAEPALAGTLAAKITGRPLIVACMGGEPVYLPEIGYGAARKWLDRTYLRLAVAGSQVMTAGSQVQADLLKAKFGDRVDPVLMPLGVDLARFKAEPKPLPESPLILAVGSLLPVKGHVRLVEAVAKIPQVRLRIAGEGPERPRLERLINRLKLNDRVQLAGAIDPLKMPDEYAAADLLALPSYYESQCVALIEGLACGLPAVAAPVGIAPELLAGRKAGELAQDNSLEALAQAITLLLARREDWPQIRQAAHTTAEMVSLERCSNKLMNLYEAIEAQPKPEKR